MIVAQGVLEEDRGIGDRQRAFSRSHTHLFYFVKDPQRFTFNADDPAVRVPSARQLVYADARANPKGWLPDNTWILRPQDLPEGCCRRTRSSGRC
jgi:hypothetical protein